MTVIHQIATGKGKTIGYIRVSTDEQNPERQLAGLILDKIFIEYASGTKTDRYQLNLLMEYVREDDVVIVHSMDRLARNVRHLLQLIDFFVGKKVKIQFLKEHLTFSGDDSPAAKLLLTMMGAVAEFEITLLKERQMEGIKIAKAAGKYKGGHTVFTPARIEAIHEALKTRKSITRIAFDVGISRCSLQKYLSKLSKEGKEDVLNYHKKMQNISTH